MCASISYTVPMHIVQQKQLILAFSEGPQNRVPSNYNRLILKSVSLKSTDSNHIGDYFYFLWNLAEK